MTSLISIRHITYAYWQPDAPAAASQRTAADLNLVFRDFSLELPPGITSIMGENGVGKSTLLLLAAARLFPAEGSVVIDGQDSREFMDAPTNPGREERRNRLVSCIFQNLELETEGNLGEVLQTVQASDPRRAERVAVLAGLNQALQLEPCLGKRLQDLSKGEMQRAILGLAISYGSKILVMDEPVFALDEGLKVLAFAYLQSYCRSTGMHLIFSAHDIDLCKTWSDQMLLLHSDHSYQLGPTAQVCTPANLEAAYRAPLSTLYQKHELYREMLLGKAGKA